MSNSGLDTSSVIVVVEPQSSIRMLITGSMRMLEFDVVKGFSSGKEALGYMEEHPVDWIIMPPMLDGEVNCLHILQAVLKTPPLKEVICSLVLDMDKDRFVLSKAFELGLFSFHSRSYSADAIKREFLNLVTQFRVNMWDRTKVAADYVRTYIKSQHHKRSLLAFEENMLKLYPGSTKILLSYAESQYMNGKEKAALSSLQQTVVLNPKLLSLCEKLKHRFTGDKNIYSEETPEGQPRNLLGISSCVVVDPDTDYLGFIAELLNGIGVGTCETFESGEEAWARLQDNTSTPPDYIIMEWRIPEVSGIQLLQRIRGDLNIPETSIIVTSSLIEKSEIPLLREIGVNHVLKKPFESPDFFKALTATIQQNFRPTEQKSLELKIERLLKSGQFDEAKRLTGVYLADRMIDKADKALIQAENEFHRDNLPRAVELAASAIKLGKKEDPRTLNLIGQCLLRQNIFDGALKFFEQANKFCSLNVERLVNISIAYSALDQKEEATRAVEKAGAVDKSSPGVMLQESRIAVENGNPEKCRAILEKMDSVAGLISSMNSRAIALARGGRYEDAIRIYQDTIRSIPAPNRQERNSVLYNLALAHARYGDLQHVHGALEQISSPEEGLARKLNSLASKVEKCMRDNTGLQLANSEEVSITGKNSPNSAGATIDFRAYSGTGRAKTRDLLPIRYMLTTIDIRPGDIGCHLIYRCIEGHHPACARLIKNQPAFRYKTEDGEDEQDLTLPGSA